MSIISSQKFASLLKDNFINDYIIDIRPSFLFNKKHIPNSLNVNENKLLKTPYNYITKDNVYYIICTRGTSSNFVSNALNKKGYITHSVQGGFNNLNLT